MQAITPFVPFGAEVGEPTYAEIFYDYEGRSKGCGFALGFETHHFHIAHCRVIEFSEISEAEAAINKMTDTKLKGRPIFVREVCFACVLFGSVWDFRRIENPRPSLSSSVTKVVVCF